jgi:PAS domain S-box-containing protein
MSEPSPNSIRILHVDDEPDFADVAATFLETEDERFTVETATSAAEGIERLTSAIDCIVSDYDMPGQNGIAFLEQVRAEYPEVPFILYTGKGSEEVASDAISAGVTDYLQKESGTDQYTVLANRIANAVEQCRAREALEASQNRLSLFIEQSPLGVIEWSEVFEVVQMNDAAEDILGYSEPELKGRSWEAIVPESDQEPVGAVVTDLLDAEGGYHSVNENVRKDGTRITCEWHNRVITDETGDTVAIFSQFQDISERKRSERELEQATERIEFALDQVNAGVWELDPETDSITSYPTYCPVFDADIETVTDFLERIHPDDRPRAESAVQTAVETGNALSVEWQTSPDIDAEWVALQVNPIEDEGAVSRVIGLVRDISDRKARQRKLTQLQQQTQALMQTCTREETAQVATDAADDVIDAPLSGAHLLNGSADMLEPAATVDQVSDTFDEVPSYQREAPSGSRAGLIWSVFEGGDPLRIDDTHEFAQLTEPTPARSVIIHPMESHGVFIVSSDEPHAFTETDEVLIEILATTLTTALDRVEQERARRDRERELEETNAVLSTLFETLPVGVLVEDAARDVIAVNQRLFELLEIHGTADEIRSADCEQLAEQVSEMFVDADGFVERINELVAEREPTENEELSLDDERTFDRSYRPIELPDGDGHLWMYRDVTNRKTREARLRALNETTHRLMTVDTRERISDIGAEAASDILGLDANAIHLYDDDQAALVPVAETDAGVELVGDIPTFTEGDSIAWRAYEQGETVALDDVHDDPDIYNPETPVRSELHLPLGDYGLLIAGSETPEAFDQQDIVFGEILADAIVVALDQREQTEQLRARERELTRQNDRLEELTSVVSHDLRNPLNVASGRLELVRQECDSEHLDTIARAHERMETLIDDLLALARHGEAASEIDSVDLATLTENCWRNVATGTATLAVDIDRRIRADRSRLKQLLENLIRNAVEHGGEDVTVSIGELGDGFYVEDDGPGIPENARDDVFDVGYSTTEDGTGFGLSIAKQVADAHGWTIRVTDSSGGGARFEIRGVEIPAE